MKKENTAMQILVGVVVIILAAALIGIWNASVDIRDATRDNGRDIGYIKTNMSYLHSDLQNVKENYATKEEVKQEISELRRSSPTITGHGAQLLNEIK